MMSDTMPFSVRTKVILFSLLVLLGVLFRYFIAPHEIGHDSFAIHLMANSISDFGYAKWWLHPTSIIGSYPYSTSPSAVPYLLSGLSQGLCRDMELIILLFSMVLGIFCIFGAYLMAGAIWNNDLFKFLVVFVFSTSLGILTLTTFTTTGRTLFVILLPLFIYLLLRIRMFTWRMSILTFVILALFFVTHHYVYFILPIIMSWLIIGLLYKSKKYVKSIRIHEKFTNFAMLAFFLIMFSIPYFHRSLWWNDPEIARAAGAASIYGWISNVMLADYFRYIGILIIFAVGGYVYLIFKRNKKFEEWFLLLALVISAPLLYISTYMKWFILPFSSLLIGVGLTNIAKMNSQKKKYATCFVILILLFSTSFAGYYQYLHFLKDPSHVKRYMEEDSYVGALWIKNSISNDRNMISDLLTARRVFSISEVATLTGVGAVDLAYGFVDPKKLEVEQIYSPLSVEYYFHDPYRTINHTKTAWYVRYFVKYDINDPHSLAYRITTQHNISYLVENIPNILTRSIQETKNNLYDNGKIQIWYLCN